MVMMDLNDYKRGALGPVHRLSAPYLAYLRVAENEENAWEAEQHRQALEKSG
jgi:hypothetical protein